MSTSGDPFSVPDWIVLLLRCRDCYKPVRRLVVSGEYTGVEDIVTHAQWASDRVTFHDPCTCNRPLPDPRTLRGYIARAVAKGFGYVDAPVVVRD
jgi:hypothetical protein